MWRLIFPRNSGQPLRVHWVHGVNVWYRICYRICHCPEPPNQTAWSSSSLTLYDYHGQLTSTKNTSQQRDQSGLWFLLHCSNPPTALLPGCASGFTSAYSFYDSWEIDTKTLAKLNWCICIYVIMCLCPTDTSRNRKKERKKYFKDAFQQTQDVLISWGAELSNAYSACFSDGFRSRRLATKILPLITTQS